MGNMIYVCNATVDGYMTDQAGSFDWGQPSEGLHAYFNDLIRPVGTFIYGRAMYEVMSYWETALSVPEHSPVEHEFARLWQSANKIVYSTTLTSVATANTRIEHAFDADAVRQLKATSSKDIGIGGANIASHAFRAGLIDECHLVVHPIIVGGGKPALPQHIRVDLELLNEQRFDGGVVQLHYRVRP
jgi:dihydrofolate reductase